MSDDKIRKFLRVPICDSCIFRAGYIGSMIASKPCGFSFFGLLYMLTVHVIFIKGAKVMSYFSGLLTFRSGKDVFVDLRLMFFIDGK